MVFSLPTLELHRSGVTLSRVAEALGYSTAYVSLQLTGRRNLDPALLAVIRALADAETADRVHALVPRVGGK